MKKASVLIFLFALIAVGFYYQKYRVEGRKDLIVIDVAGGYTYVDLRNKTITLKTSVFPVILWADENGAMYSERHMITYRAYITANLPANEEEIALYRKYFL